MTNFSIFESNLREYFVENIRRSHIEDLLREEYNSVKITVGSSSVIVVSLEGYYTLTRHFSDLSNFYRNSEILGDLEGLVYQLVTACDSAEKASNGFVPKSYSVEVIAESPEVFYHKLQILKR